MPRQTGGGWAEGWGGMKRYNTIYHLWFTAQKWLVIKNIEKDILAQTNEFNQ